MDSIDLRTRQCLERGNVFLEASAGTGKTYSIVEIVKNLLRDQYSLERIAIITFTEKAAGELSERIRKGIQEEIKKDTHRTDFFKNLETLPHASIGTIHQFCRDLLNRNPENSDFFSLKEEKRDLSQEHSRAFSNFLEVKESEAIQSKTENEFIDFFYRYDWESLKEFCQEVWEQSKGHTLKHPKAPDSQEIQTRFKKLILDIESSQPSCKLLKFVANELVSSNLFSNLKEKKFLSKDSSLNKTTNSDIKAHPNFEKWNSEFKEIEKELEYLETYPKLVKIYSFINEYLLFFSNFKSKENLIGTEEVIEATLNMLYQFPETREKISKEYDYIILDECQDTDPSQFHIFKLLSEKNLDRNYQCPKIIFVGDKKQSIYKFRNADLKILNETIQAQVPVNNIIELDTTYRSRENLTQGFNKIFSSLQSNSFSYKIVQTGREDYIAKAKNPALFLSFSDSLISSSKEARILGFTHILNFINLVKGNSQYPIWAKGENQGYEKVPGYSDIAVLGQSREQLSKLQSFLLSNNIPCSTYKEKDFYSQELINSLSYLLHCIENPSDSSSLFFALQSPLFLISLSFLSKLSEQNSLSYLKPFPENEEFSEIKRIFEALKKAHVERYMHSASYIIQRILEIAESIPRLASGFEGRRNLTNLYHYFEILDESQYKNSLSFGELAREMRHRVQKELEGEKKIDFEEKDPNQESVRLMTVHSAKGLEFPICIQLSMFRNQNSQRKMAYTPRQALESKKKELSIEFSFKSNESTETLGYLREAAIHNSEVTEEEERLFYVSLTRARDYLFLPCIFPNSPRIQPTPFSKKLASVFNKDSTLVQDLLKEELAMIIESENQTQENIKRTKEKNLVSIEPEELYKKIPSFAKIEEKGTFKIVSYSSLHSKEEQKPKQENTPKEKRNLDSEENPNLGSEFGKACHSILELTPLDLLNKPKKLEKELKNLVTLVFSNSGIHTENPDYNSEKLFQLVKKALEHKYTIDGIQTRISDWQYIQMERKFYSPGESLGDLMLGIGDMLFYFNDKYYILDWKTDNFLDPNELEIHTLNKYKNQMYIYSWILVQNLMTVKPKSEEYNWESIYEKEYGGMLYVYLRYLDHPSGVIHKKLPAEEIIKFIK